MTKGSKLRARVVAAAVTWWEGLRPGCVSIEWHWAHPTVKANNEGERQLARAVAEYTKGVWCSDDTPALVQDLLELARELDKNLRMPADVVFKKHEIYRRAEVFLGKREVNDETTPKPIPRRPIRTRAR